MGHLSSEGPAPLPLMAAAPASKCLSAIWTYIASVDPKGPGHLRNWMCHSSVVRDLSRRVVDWDAGVPNWLP